MSSAEKSTGHVVLSRRERRRSRAEAVNERALRFCPSPGPLRHEGCNVVVGGLEAPVDILLRPEEIARQEAIRERYALAFRP